MSTSLLRKKKHTHIYVCFRGAKTAYVYTDSTDKFISFVVSLPIDDLQHHYQEMIFSATVEAFIMSSLLLFICLPLFFFLK